MHQCNLDGSQKEGGTFFNLLLKEGVPRMGGSLGKGGGEGGGGPTLGGNYETNKILKTCVKLENCLATIMQLY